MQIIIDFISSVDLQRKLRDLLQDDRTTFTTTAEQVVHIAKPTKEPFNKSKRWTQYELDNVRDWYLNKTYTAKEMGKALGRSPTSVAQVIYTMTQKGLPKRSKRAGKVFIEQK